VKIVSYNLLGHIYLAGHMDDGNPDYVKVPLNLRDWEFRKSMLMKQFEQFDADMYLLQEADRFNFVEQFGEFFVSKGYGMVLQESKKAKSDHPVCLCTVYRTSMFEHLSSDHRSRTLVSAFNLVSENRVVYVINVHLEGHWTLENKRLSQLVSAFGSLDKLYKKHEAPPVVEKKKKDKNKGKKNKKNDNEEEAERVIVAEEAPVEETKLPEAVNPKVLQRRVILGGDFNSSIDEKVGKWMSTGTLVSDEATPGKDLQTPCSFQVALDPKEKLTGLLTSTIFLHGRLLSKVDFIWYSSETISQLDQSVEDSSWLTIPNDEEFAYLVESSLPNLKYPSDHLPVVYQLEIR